MRRDFKWLKHIILCSLSFGLLFYSLFHILWSQKGWSSYVKISAEVQEQRQSLRYLARNKAIAAHRSSMLNPKSIDIDMLEEVARRSLCITKPEEIVVIAKPAQ